MKSKRLKWIATVAVFAVLASAVQLAAQGKNTHEHHQFQLLDLGTFGGPSSYLVVGSQVLSNNGVVAGGGYDDAGSLSRILFQPRLFRFSCISLATQA